MAKYVGSHEQRRGFEDQVYTDYLDEYIWAEMVEQGKASYGPGTDNASSAEIMDQCVREYMGYETDWSVNGGGYEKAGVACEMFLKDVADRKAYLASLSPNTVPEREPSSRLTDGELPDADKYSHYSAAYDIVSAMNSSDCIDFRNEGGDEARGANPESKHHALHNLLVKLQPNDPVEEHDARVPSYGEKGYRLTPVEMQLASDDELLVEYLVAEAGALEVADPKNMSVPGYNPPDLDADGFNEYRQHIRDEFASRGITDEMLEQKCEAYKADLMARDVSELHTFGSADYTIRVTASRHNGNEVDIAEADRLATYVSPATSASKKIERMRDNKRVDEQDFLTEEELKSLSKGDSAYVFSAYSKAVELVDKGELAGDSATYHAQYDLMYKTFEESGQDMTYVQQESAKIRSAELAEEKLTRTLDNPTEFPSKDNLLTADELASIDDTTLLEQFTLARFCATQDNDRWSHNHVAKVDEAKDISDVSEQIVEEYDLAGEAAQKEAGGAWWCDPEYVAYYEAVKAECESRGYNIRDLETTSDQNIINAQECSMSNLVGVGLNIRMLSAMNDAPTQALHYYMTLTAQEKEMEPRFKSVLEGQTIGASGAGRWDGARGDRDPLQKEALTLTFGEGDNQYQTKADLMAEMYPGTEYEVKTYSYYDRNGHHMMYCHSPYLGNFVYDGNDWGIGYKEIPGTEGDNPDGSLTKVPVFKYVGDVKADWQHGGKSPAGMIGEYSIGDIGTAAGTNALNGGAWLLNQGINAIDFFGWIDDDPIGYRDDGYTNEQQVQIPHGVKNLDYTFEDNDEIQLIPAIPSTVESMHCTFMNCDTLYDSSSNFGYNDQWHLPDNLKDFSYTFAGCKKLRCDQLGEFPHHLLTINGAFYDCERILDKRVWEDWTLDLGQIGKQVKEADWSENPYLREEFAKPVNENTSERMKANALDQEHKLREYQFEYSQPENREKWTEQELEDWQDANAAATAERTKKVINGELTVRSIDTIAYNKPEQNEFSAFLQRAMIDVGSFALLKGVTGGVTGSKVAGWAAGLGGTFLLRHLDILPKSIEPVLNLIKGVLPESAQGTMDKVMKFFHLPGQEEENKARYEQMAVYKDEALRDSINLSAWSAAGIRDDNKIYEAMRTNGRAVAEYGVLQYCGELGEQSTDTMTTVLRESMPKAESVFREKLANVGTDKDDGYDWAGTVNVYYYQLLSGMEGYSSGATAGIESAYGSGAKVSDTPFGKAKDTEENNKRRANAEKGLAYVNCDYVNEVMTSMVKMDNEYYERTGQRLITEETWGKISTLNIYGVDTMNLYAYDPNFPLEPTMLTYGANMYDYDYGYDPSYGHEPSSSASVADTKTTSVSQEAEAETKGTASEEKTKAPAETKSTTPPKSSHETRVKQAEDTLGVSDGSDEAEAEADYSSAK